MAERLEAKHRGGTLVARKIEFSETSDPVEICFERGWSDGLPVTPPTDERVLAMLTRERLKGYPDVPTAKELGFIASDPFPLGVVGPTRMPYPRAVGSVRYVATLLSELVSRFHAA